MRSALWAIRRTTSSATTARTSTRVSPSSAPTRLQDRIDCDPDYETQSKPWVEALPPLLAKAANGDASRSGAAKADGDAKADGSKSLANGAHKEKASGYGKANPYHAKLIGNVRLNGEGAGKDTRSFRFLARRLRPRLRDRRRARRLAGKLPGDGRRAARRDRPRRDARIDLKGKGEISLGEALAKEFELTRPSREMLRFIAERSDNKDLAPLLADDRKQDLKDFLWGRQLADLLGEFPVRASPDEFVAGLKRMQPRLYSISSSPKAHPDEVHLTVSAVRYGARKRKGTCSTFLADRASEAGVPIFVQPSSHFHLPADPDVPVIMIGPGTGVAPFRGFLHERRVMNARGATGCSSVSSTQRPTSIIATS